MIQRSACLHFQRSMLSKPNGPGIIWDLRFTILDFVPEASTTMKLNLRRTLVRSVIIFSKMNSRQIYEFQTVLQPFYFLNKKQKTKAALLQPLKKLIVFG